MAKGKSFRDTAKESFSNPAMQFISEGSKANAGDPEPAKTGKPARAPEGYKPNPEYIETRSKRLQLLIQPSLYEAMKARADREGRSLNDLIHSTLENEFKK